LSDRKADIYVIEGGKSEALRDLVWFVARVRHPLSEFKVVDDLLDRGVDAYAPWETVWSVNRRRTWLRKVRKFAMIPRYIFVKLDPDKPRTDLIEDIVGVELLRTSDGAPCQVRGEQLDRIRWHQIRGLYDHTTENNATAKRKAKKELRAAVSEAEAGKRYPRGPRERAIARTHPYGETYRVASK
jgi:transcription antitermination factor NusG